MIRSLCAVFAALALSQAGHARQAAPAAADPVAETFKAWDRNADGQLSLAEFRSGWQQARAAAREQAALRRQFAAIDTGRDGAIDQGEYGNLLLIKQAGKAAPPLARFDANGNGKLEFAEYVNLVETLAPQDAASKGARK